MRRTNLFPELIAAPSFRPVIDTLYLRGFGELTLLSSLPTVVVVLFAAVTQLADSWFVFSLLAILYIWPVLGLQRRESARLFALALFAAAVVLTLKVAIGVPRPPGSTAATVPGWLPWPLSEAFHRVAADDGFGFPSGHATAATVLYGGLAALLEWRQRRDRVVIASVLVLAVMCSRVVLGLHFLVDVLAGGVLGAGILWIGLRRGDPGHWFGGTALVAVVGGTIAALHGHPAEVHDATIGAGSAVGGMGGWYFASRSRQRLATAVRPITGVLVASLAAVAWTFAYLFGATFSNFAEIADVVTLLSAATMAAVAIGLVVGLPAVLSRWERREK